MARRGRNSSDGSLDLLLDTICNTFGGVLFISMLVVILLNLAGEQASEEPPEPSQQADLVEAKVKLDERQQELERLKTAVSLLAGAADETEAKLISELIARLQAAEAMRLDLIQKKAMLVSQLSQDQADTNDQLQQNQDLRQKLAAAQQQLLQITRKVEEEKKKRSKEIKPKPARPTTKTEAVTFLKDGRLCVYALPNSSGQLAPNTSAFAHKTDNKGQYVEPRPAGGIRVDPNGSNTSVRRQISRFDHRKFYVAVFVWPDSFDHFQAVKQILLDEQYEYRLVPMNDDEKIYTGGSAPTARVQGGG